MKIETEHYTLILGDSLEELTAVRNADLCVTDAPYLLTSGGKTEGGMHERMGGDYDNSGNFFEGECPEWAEFSPLIFDALRENAHYYSMADSKNQFEMQRSAMAAGFRFHNLLYWDKGTCTANRWYMKNAEYVGFFFKGTAFSINDCGSKQGIYVRHNDETMHPTEKPVHLMQHYILNSSQLGETVLDPFMGTGTTGVAAVMAGRKFIGIERDPKWFDVARMRLEQAVLNISKQTMDLFCN